MKTPKTPMGRALKIHCRSNTTMRFGFRGPPLPPVKRKLRKSKRKHQGYIAFWRDLFKQTLPNLPNSIYTNVREKRLRKCVLPDAGWFHFIKITMQNPAGFLPKPPIKSLKEMIDSKPIKKEKK